jgi:hypothetical protein
VKQRGFVPVQLAVRECFRIKETQEPHLPHEVVNHCALGTSLVTSHGYASESEKEVYESKERIY